MSGNPPRTGMRSRDVIAGYATRPDRTSPQESQAAAGAGHRVLSPARARFFSNAAPRRVFLHDRAQRRQLPGGRLGGIAFDHPVQPHQPSPMDGEIGLFVAVHALQGHAHRIAAGLFHKAAGHLVRPHGRDRTGLHRQDERRGHRAVIAQATARRNHQARMRTGTGSPPACRIASSQGSIFPFKHGRERRQDGQIFSDRRIGLDSGLQMHCSCRHGKRSACLNLFKP